MGVIDVPPPLLGEGMVLIRTRYSLLSPGTEGGTVLSGRKSLIDKARERPEQVRQVIETLKQSGPLQTHRAVMKRLEAFSPLGYSIAGTVAAVGSRTRGFAVGDNVAAAGAGYANHAELNAVPAKLCVKLDPDADLQQAAYNTLGAIALQGIRQADLRLGETCVVIGLGLIGQLTALMLRASGVIVIGLDIRQWAVAFAERHGIDHAFAADEPNLPEAVQEITGGIGADAVIITAATDSLVPINLAGRLLRKRGVVVVVGAVPTGFDREPDYYKKEISLKMSCSYGPGRYDPLYEERGIDYPPGYVRWTEQRNMAAFQEMIRLRRIEISHLTTHRVPLEEAKSAYDMILDRRDNYLGILLEYGNAEQRELGEWSSAEPQASSTREDTVYISFIGAGSYAMSYLLPNMQNAPKTQLMSVLSATGSSSRSVAEKYGFARTAAAEAEILEGSDTTAVFVATPHDSHARLVVQALEHGKHVFVEKPLCLTEAELELIYEKYQQSRERYGGTLLMVGFNRRFAPLAIKIKEGIGAKPMNILYRINAGYIPPESWIQDPDLGGGRIIGEVCHFVDLLTFLTSALPVRVYAAAMRDAAGCNDTLSITLSFADGSLGTIGYFANGSKKLRKEYVEVYSCGKTFVLHDFKDLEIYEGKARARRRLLSQDKGQKPMVDAFLRSCRQEASLPITVADIFSSMKTTFAVVESLRTGAAVEIPLRH